MLRITCFLLLFYLFNPVFAQEKIHVRNIKITGNHITKADIILRELTLKQGDSITIYDLDKEIQKSKENLTNLLLFNFVFIRAEQEENSIDIFVEVKERWYLWPYPIIEISERNFNVWWDEFQQSNYTDFSRLNYGVFLVWENVNGRNQLLKTKFRKGFKEHYLLQYDIPYLNKSKTIGLSGISQVFRRKKTFFQTKNNQLVYYEAENYTATELENILSVSYHNNPRQEHELQLHYFNATIADTIATLNPNYFGNGQNKGNYYQIAYQFTNEQRDYIEYPLKGYYFLMRWTKNFSSSCNVPQFELYTKAEKHLQILPRTFLGSSFTTKISSNEEQSYFVQKGLGFEDYARTYEYYVVDGQHFWISRTALKYALIEKTNFDIPYVKASQFKDAHFSLYIGLFSDLAYVKDNQTALENPLANHLLWGKGISIDYVTYYDKLLRIELGINKLGEKGLFLHFSNPF